MTSKEDTHYSLSIVVSGPPAGKHYKIVCDGKDARRIRADVGWTVSWTNQLGEGLTLEFFGSTDDDQRRLHLWEGEGRLREIPIPKGETREITIASNADRPLRGENDPCDRNNVHLYRVVGWNFDAPGPGIIVCPPNDPNCP